MITNLSANGFIIKHDGLIDERAQAKINEIGTELREKTNTNVYVFIMESNGINPDNKRSIRIKQMREFDKRIINNLEVKNNYAVLVLSINQAYANILLSKNMVSVIDKDDVLDGYVIPLLASKDKNSLFSKTSAALLNGYAQIADSIASSKHITLKSSIGNVGKTTSSIWRVFIYSLVVFGIGAYFVILLKQRKKSKR
jgi:hypothetical protein